MYTEKRIEFVDYAKAIGIILVVAGHINVYNGCCKLWVYAFHMPLFFLLAGLFLHPTIDFKAAVVKRSKRLLLPYFIWGLIFAELSVKNIVCIGYGSQYTLKAAQSLSSLWFFPVLFLAYIMGVVIITMQNRYKSLWGGLLMVVGFFLPRLHYGYPWGLNIACVAAGLILVGRCVSEKVMRLRMARTPSLLLLSCLLGVATIGAYCNKEIDMARAVYGNPLLFILFAFVGSAFVVCLAILLERIKMGKAKKYMLFIGQNSLTIMLLHKPMLSALEKAFRRTMLPDGVCLVVIAIIAVALCYVGCLFLNGVIPQIVGRER